MLAVIGPVMVLLVIFIILGVMFIIPKMKRSEKIDKLVDGLFEEPEENTTENLMHEVKNVENQLVEKSKENAQVIKDKEKEKKKIDGFLKKKN